MLKGGTGHQIRALTAPGSAQQHHSQLTVLRRTRSLIRPSLLTLSHSSRTVDSRGARVTALTMGMMGYQHICAHACILGPHAVICGRFRCAMQTEHASTGRVATRTSTPEDAIETSVAAPHRQLRHRVFAPHQPVRPAAAPPPPLALPPPP